MFGAAWWRLCLLFHHPWLIPTSRFATIRLTQSFHRPELKICRCAAS